MAPIEHIKNLLEGFGSVLDTASSRGYAVPKGNGFASDARNLAKDSATVSRRINSAIGAYGKSSNHR